MEDRASAARLLIADDHDPIRSSFKKILETQPDLEVVAEAANGREASELCSELRPDLVLMDVRMPKMDGLQATRRIKRRLPQTVVLMLTAFEDEDYLLQALEVGASGYLLKYADPEELISAVRKALRGEFPLDTELATGLLRRLVGEGRERTAKEQAAVPELVPEAVRIRLLGGLRSRWEIG